MAFCCIIEYIVQVTQLIQISLVVPHPHRDRLCGCEPGSKNINVSFVSVRLQLPAGPVS